jgi:hypothetical protein
MRFPVLRLPNDLSDDLSDNRSDYLSDNRPENRSDYLSDKWSDNRSDYLSDNRSDNRSDYLSDNRSDSPRYIWEIPVRRVKHRAAPVVWKISLSVMPMVAFVSYPIAGCEQHLHPSSGILPI